MVSDVACPPALGSPQAFVLHRAALWELPFEEAVTDEEQQLPFDVA